MYEFGQTELREVREEYRLSYSKVLSLLSECGLVKEKTDYMAGIFDEDGECLACGGYDGRTVKCVAVREDARGTGLSNTLITHLLQKLDEEGAKAVSVFTKPENELMFSSFGFKLVERAEKAIFLEKTHNGINEYVEKLRKTATTGNNGCIVMNANPFTKGHRYLIEYAASECDHLYVFVLNEDLSDFPFEVRYDLVKKGTSHIKNVTVLKGGRYIISNSVFPSYFIKEYSDVTMTHATLDVKIFGHYIAPALNIKRRYAGEEPTDKVTSVYNGKMKELLPLYGVTPVIIPRLEEDGKTVSASLVRKAIKEKDFALARLLVPDVTCDYIENGSFFERVSRIAEKALIDEVSATPKPGLVDRNNPGANSDMDINTFVKSAKCLKKYFSLFTWHGYENAGLPLNKIFESGRKIGIDAEEDMFEVTNGVNTHKGVIFTVGLLCMAVGYLKRKGLGIKCDSLCDTVSEMTKGLCEKDLSSLECKQKLTHGEAVYRSYGLKGSRGQAEAGLPAVRKSYAFLKSLIEKGTEHNEVLVRTLIYTMSFLDDTNIVKRAGKYEAETVKKTAESLVFAPFCDIIEYDKLLISKNISAGGCADVLATSWFIYMAENNL